MRDTLWMTSNFWSLGDTETKEDSSLSSKGRRVFLLKSNVCSMYMELMVKRFVGNMLIADLHL